jgi:hypothetical protein
VTEPRPVFRIKSRELRIDRLVIGASARSELRLDDPIAADRHCELELDGERLRVRDLGSTTGTFVDGVRVPPGGVELVTPCELVVGCSRIAIDRKPGRVTLQPRERAFHFAEPRRGENQADRSEWTFSELRLGRMRSLTLVNRAAVVAVALGAVLLFTRPLRERFVSPGPLSRAHARLFDGVASTPRQAALGVDFVAIALTTRKSSQPIDPAALASSEGCGICHLPGRGVPIQKCATCHGDLVANQHPFANDHATGKLAGVSSSFESGECNGCHLEHSGEVDASGSSVGVEVTKRSQQRCLDCHAETKVAQAIAVARAANESGDHAAATVAVQREAPSVPMDARRRLWPIAFAHRDHVGRDVDGNGSVDVDIACATCHESVRKPHEEDRAVADANDDFLLVPFATCAGCHVRGREPSAERAEQFKKWQKVQALVDAEGQLKFVWDVRWHGSHDAANCLECHRSLDSRAHWLEPGLPLGDGPLADVALAAQHAGLKTTPRRVRAERPIDATEARYDVARRGHTDEFKGPDDCGRCHQDSKIVAQPAPVEGPFLHFMHLSKNPVADDDADRPLLVGQCAKCHLDLAESKALTSLPKGSAFHWNEPQACSPCHRGDKKDPLAITAAHGSAALANDESLPLPDFPHSRHVPHDGNVLSKRLDKGCFTCHEFVAPVDGDVTRAAARTRTECRDCRYCHAKHENVAGNACKKCHPQTTASDAQGPPAYHSFWGEDPPPERPILTRSWPSGSQFHHSSRGHAALADPLSEQADCLRCHAKGRLPDDKPGALAAAGSIREIPVPTEQESACRNCHLDLGTFRFHWR